MDLPFLVDRRARTRAACRCTQHAFGADFFFTDLTRVDLVFCASDLPRPYGAGYDTPPHGEFFYCQLLQSSKTTKKEAFLLPLRGNRQRPILPGRVQPSTFGTGELNYCVRYGNRWDLSVITTGRFSGLLLCYPDNCTNRIQYFQTLQLISLFL